MSLRPKSLYWCGIHEDSDTLFNFSPMFLSYFDCVYQTLLDTLVEHWINVFPLLVKSLTSVTNESTSYECSIQPYFISKWLIATLIPTLTLPAM